MAVDARALEMLKRGQVPPGLSIGAVAPHVMLSDEVQDELLKRAADEEVYKRKITEEQLGHARAGRALEIIANLTQLNLCKAESHANTEDLDASRKARRAAIDVLQSYLETQG